jgi:hypothetical protein
MKLESGGILGIVAVRRAAARQHLVASFPGYDVSGAHSHRRNRYPQDQYPDLRSADLLYAQGAFLFAGPSGENNHFGLKKFECRMWKRAAERRLYTRHPNLPNAFERLWGERGVMLSEARSSGLPLPRHVLKTPL